MSLSGKTSPIRFFHQDASFSLTNRTELKKFILQTFKRHGLKLISLNYIFTSDKAVLKINRDFLKHDFYTDIITFDLGNPDGVEAEIYISIDRVRENAKTHQTPFKKELHRVIFHGVLHLCGLKDKSGSEAKTMRVAEEALLAKYFKS